MTKFIFDLDGTVTKDETLPLISKHFNVEEELMNLTMDTVQGRVPFVESFIRRVYILGKLPVNDVSELLRSVELYDEVVNFINSNSDNCCIATGNLRCWTKELEKIIRCPFYCSEGRVKDDNVEKIESILKKENIVKRYKAEGYKVVFIGDGNNDVEAMRYADVSIASALTHTPASAVLSVADYCVYTEVALCRQLNQLL